VSHSLHSPGFLGASLQTTADARPAMSETARRLKDHLNTNQSARERMCLEVLAVQPGYTEIHPRLPEGGPDGGKDIEGLYEGKPCVGAVGFINNASDTKEHRDRAKAKFKEDLDRVIDSNNGAHQIFECFVFFTNVALTPTIIKNCKKLAYDGGINNCDIYDRERIRIALDSNRGYAIRLRYLDIPLNDAEQKDFFGAWGDEINDAIGAKFLGIDKATKRIQFLLEAGLLVDHLSVRVKLTDSIWNACRSEFFFQTTLALRAHVDGLAMLTFGGGTAEIKESFEEWAARETSHTKNSQYGFAFSKILQGMPKYDQFVDGVEHLEHSKRSDNLAFEKEIRTHASEATLPPDSKVLYFEALSEPFIHRFFPTCKLIELDRSFILFDCSRDLAENIEEITIYANEYELLKIYKNEMRVEDGKFERLRIPKEGKQVADSGDWVTIRPSGTISCFTIDLGAKTPKRFDWDDDFQR